LYVGSRRRKLKKKVLGVQLYTVRDFTKNRLEFSATLEKIAEIGYKSVEISALGKLQPRKIADLIDDNGLVVAGAHTDWHRFLKELDDVIYEYKVWDCHHAVVGGLPAEYYSFDGLEKFLKELVPIVDKLLLEGIDFSYHNHSHEMIRYGRKTWLEMLFENASTTVLKGEIDVYWIQYGGGDPIKWIRKCKGRLPLLHLKDMAVTPSGERQFAEVGEGNLNWVSILSAAKESNVEWYLVEQDLCYGRDPFESLSISYRNLEKMDIH
jgi:sugar phosphate isomerase/epimerase